MSIQKGLAEEIHRPRRRNYPTARVLIKGVLDDLWQADLVDLSRFPDEGYKFLLTVIDAGSKKAFAEPLKSKSATELERALTTIFEKSGSPPRHLQTDKGSEFYNKRVKQLLKDNNVNLYSSHSNVKASIVERFNRTLKRWMWIMFTARGHRKWVSLLPELMDYYNNRVHRSIGMKPVDVTKEHEASILRRLFPPTNHQMRRKPKFKIGDRVRISRFKGTFEKGYLPSWTNEQFIVARIRSGVVPTYYLKDIYDEPIVGRFYEQELLKTKYPDYYLVEKILKRRGDKALVRWLSFSPKFDSWEPIKNLEVGD
ncbi:protein F54H12.3, partial Hydra magnipapillata [Nesidiocoris tenuis]|uniref:Protein F54H12.3, partial Hydra magnipapillata n=1 Tax=Nesidiocoris tenuis TaxID=355587 RepID=A0ABN7ACB4_9HEMI